jgi:hypothetical protein
MNNKEEVLMKLKRVIALINQKNKNDQEKFKEMLFLALVSKTEEIGSSLNFLMNFVRQLISGAEIETLLNAYLNIEEYKEEDVLLLINEVENIFN